MPTNSRWIQLWKVSFKGGAPVQVTRNDGVYAIESRDGRFLYYPKLAQPGIWKMPLKGGEETRVLDQPGTWFNWALARPESTFSMRVLSQTGE